MKDTKLFIMDSFSNIDANSHSDMSNEQLQEFAKKIRRIFKQFDMEQKLSKKPIQ
jgi:Asp-tRNA(Asn)/Glu-tRNA(Gln) amidotransferase C subunit